MTRLKCFIHMAALLLFVVGCKSSQPNKSNKFALEINSNKTVFRRNEPIKLFYKYINKTTLPQKLCRLHFWACNKVILTTEDDTPVQPTAMGLKCQAQLRGLSENSRPFSIDLKPGMHVGSYIRNLQQYFKLQKKQQYKLQLIFYDWNAPPSSRLVYSNTLHFKIR